MSSIALSPDRIESIRRACFPLPILGVEPGIQRQHVASFLDIARTSEAIGNTPEAASELWGYVEETHEKLRAIGNPDADLYRDGMGRLYDIAFSSSEGNADG